MPLTPCQYLFSKYIYGKKVSCAAAGASLHDMTRPVHACGVTDAAALLLLTCPARRCRLAMAGRIYAMCTHHKRTRYIISISFWVKGSRELTALQAPDVQKIEVFRGRKFRLFFFFEAIHLSVRCGCIRRLGRARNGGWTAGEFVRGTVRKELKWMRGEEWAIEKDEARRSRARWQFVCCKPLQSGSAVTLCIVEWTFLGSLFVERLPIVCHFLGVLRCILSAVRRNRFVPSSR